MSEERLSIRLKSEAQRVANDILYDGETANGKVTPETWFYIKGFLTATLIEQPNISLKEAVIRLGL